MSRTTSRIALAWLLTSASAAAQIPPSASTRPAVTAVAPAPLPAATEPSNGGAPASSASAELPEPRPGEHVEGREAEPHPSLTQLAPAPPAPPVPTAIPAPTPPPVPQASAPPPTTPPPATDAPPSLSSAPLLPDLASHEAAQVRLGDDSVFSIRAAVGDKPAAERARQASKALSLALTQPDGEVRVERAADTAVVYYGSIPIVQLHARDAVLAGDASLEVHAGRIAAQVRLALGEERQRSQVAQNVFSISLVVFLALIGLYLVRKIGDLAHRLRDYLGRRADQAFAIRIQSIEVVRPAVIKSGVLVALGLVKWIGQFAVLYLWLVGVLSLFEVTRGYTERLTGFVTTPLSQLMGRMVTALPLLVVAAFAALAVVVLVRFVGLFFGAVARKETALDWLAPDLARPTSVIIQVGIVIAALVFAAPVVTGDPGGALGRAGTVALVTVGLAATPLFASGLVGAVILFGRRLRVGQYVSISGYSGRVSSIDLLATSIGTSAGSEVRIPHLALMRMPLTVHGMQPRVSVEICVAAATESSLLVSLLREAAQRVGREIEVQLLSIDREGLGFRVSAVCDSPTKHNDLAISLLQALSQRDISLGQARAPRQSE